MLFNDENVPAGFWEGAAAAGFTGRRAIWNVKGVGYLGVAGVGRGMGAGRVGKRRWWCWLVCNTCLIYYNTYTES